MFGRISERHEMGSTEEERSFVMLGLRYRGLFLVNAWA